MRLILRVFPERAGAYGFNKKHSISRDMLAIKQAESRSYLLQLHHDERVGRREGHIVLGRDGARPGRRRGDRVQFQVLEPQVQVVLELCGLTCQLCWL